MFLAKIQRISRQSCGLPNPIGSVWLLAFVSSLLVFSGGALAQHQSSPSLGIHKIRHVPSWACL